MKLTAPLTAQIFKILTFILFVFSLVSNINFFLSEDKHETYINPLPYEKYNTNLKDFDSLEEIFSYIDEHIAKNKPGKLEITIFIDDFLRERFAHGINYYRNSQNWILKILSIIFPEKEFLSIMDVNDISKYEMASCNQQALLFQEIVKRYDINYGSVSILAELKNEEELFGHFASFVEIDEKKYFFDSNLEPVYDRRQPETLNNLVSGSVQTLSELYPHFIFDPMPVANISLHDFNRNPAYLGILFQKITMFLSQTLWIFTLIIYLFARRYL